MNWFQALLMGVFQGLTEFLPVSSTAHLRVIPHFLGWPDPGAAFSAVIQLGTLAAVFVFFAADIRRLTAAAWLSARHRSFRHSDDARLAWSILPGTVPIAALGLGFREFIESGARDLQLIAAALIVLALLLFAAELWSKRTRTMAELGFWQIQLIGLCQALALIPGCSRSGSTIMGGLIVGLRREDAARFSFLLGLPAIGASGLLQLFELAQQGMATEGFLHLGLGIAAAALSGYAAIGFLLRFLQRHGTYLFSIYRLILGAAILYGL
jgi:undecaprenyl-diphosphatase